MGRGKRHPPALVVHRASSQRAVDSRLIHGSLRCITPAIRAPREVFSLHMVMHAGLPILRWAGSKRSSASEVLKLFDSSAKRYLEPFCGSAAIYFKISVQEAILSDINHHLINFYKIVRERAGEVHDYVVRLSRDSDTYYRSREEFNNTADLFLNACLFYYLNKNCFNGLFRTAKNGHFNGSVLADSCGRLSLAGSFPPLDRGSEASEHYLCGF